MPVLGPKPAFFSYHLMRIYNRRFKAIALARRAAGEAGTRNDGRRVKALFDLQARTVPHGRHAGVKLWIFAELDHLAPGGEKAVRGGRRRRCKRCGSKRAETRDPRDFRDTRDKKRALFPGVP